MISVIIPLYNKELSIGRTIESVLKQTYAKFELIVVDDGSTDSSAEVVEKIFDQRIRLIKKNNGGVSSARNKGVVEAKYDWVAFLDADDLWHEDYLLEISKVVAKHIDIEGIATGFATVNKDGTIVKSRVTDMSGVVNYFKASNELGYYVMNMSTFCTKKKSLLSIGMFSESLTHGEDMEVFEKLARKGNMYIVNKVLSYYVMDAENRAMNTLPSVHKTHVYLADTSKIELPEERNYYLGRILVYIHYYIMNLQLKNAYILFKKHYGFVTINDLLSFEKKVLRKKLSI